MSQPTPVPAPRLMLGDCIEKMAELDAASIDLILADPPYGMTACAWDSAVPAGPMWAQFRRILRPRGAAILTSMQPFTTDLIASNRRWFRYSMVWEKDRATGFLDANRRPLRAHEDVLVFARGRTTYNPQFGAGRPYVATRKGRVIETLGPKKATAMARMTASDGRRYPRTVLYFPADRGTVHPTQKPVALFEYLVRTYSHEGGSVLDFTMGSGTSGVACARAGRAFVGIERDPAFFRHAADRLAAGAT